MHFSACVAALCLSFPASLALKSDIPLLDAEIDTLVEQLLEDMHVPGLAVAVVLNGKMESKGYGYSRLPHTRATENSRWFTGSTTKAFVAAAAGVLVQNESVPAFKWSSPLADLLPGDFALSEEYQSLHTTLEDALSHRSGLPRYDAFYGWAGDTAVDVARKLRHLPLTASPRTRWQYCNAMFGTVGAILERHARLKLEQVLRDWIWMPLGMKHTTFSVAEAAHSGKLAVGYYWDAKGQSYVPERYHDILPVAGAGATVSSAHDYALWIRALLAAANGLESEDSPLTLELMEALWTPRSLVDVGIYSSGALPPPITYSLGWFATTVREYGLVAHSGGVPGFGTQVFLLPGLKFAFVSMGNTQTGGAEVGARVFMVLLKRLFSSFSSEGDLDSRRLAQSLPPLPDMRSMTSSSGSRSKLHDSTTRPKLPGKIADYTGIYVNPAYGPFNVTFASPSDSLPAHYASAAQAPLGDPSSTLTLLVTGLPRTFGEVYLLRHKSHTVFDAEVYVLHGPTPENGNVTCNDGEQSERVHHARETERYLACKDETVWERLATARAMFEYGPDGSIAKLGIEVEEELVRHVEEEGRDWREGMIWFTKA